MDFADAMREERGEMELKEFAEFADVYWVTLAEWENGEKYPLSQTVNKMAYLFLWDDEKRMSLMPPPPPRASKLSIEMLNKLRFHDITYEELGDYLGYTKSTIGTWTRGNVSKQARDAVREFLLMDRKEIEEKVIKESEKPRGEIDLDLLLVIEERYSHLEQDEHWDEDDPDVIKFREKLM